MIKIYKDDKAYSGKIQPANMRHKHPGMLRKDNGFNLAATVPLPWACRFLNVPPIWNGQGQGDRTMLFFFGCQRYRLLVEIGRGFVCWTMLEAANSPAIGSRSASLSTALSIASEKDTTGDLGSLWIFQHFSCGLAYWCYVP